MAATMTPAATQPARPVPPRYLRPGLRPGLELSPEDEIALLSCGTRVRREASAARVRELAASADWRALQKILEMHGLLGLVGTRLREIGVELPPKLDDRLERTLEHARLRALLFQATVDRICAALDARGIRSLPLKGVTLAEAIYPDPGLRLYGDVDILVAAGQLREAAAALSTLGYGPPRDPARVAGLPQLHFHVEDPRGRLPAVELHWRVHWFETQFSPGMLAASDRQVGNLRAQPTDELAALLLFYARDGFIGLRLAGDIASWWDACGEALPDRALDALAARHPELAPAWRVAATVAEQVVGLPARRVISPTPLGRRGELAVRLANWTLVGEVDQISANVTLVDALLSPHSDAGSLARRHLLLPDDVLDDYYRIPPQSQWRRLLWRILHPPKILLRYLLALNTLRTAGRWAPARPV
jgi:hypothetical protein